MNKSGDAVLATGLLTSPWWADILANINAILTSATLTLGLILGLIRVVVEIKKLIDHLKNKDGDDDRGA